MIPRFEADSLEFWTWWRDSRARLIAAMEAPAGAKYRIRAGAEEIRWLKQGLASVERLIARRLAA
jgi:hypothetical protein